MMLFQTALVLGGLSALQYPFRVGAATVQLDNATLFGFTNDSVTSYLGIPFAHPPYVPTATVYVYSRC